MKKERRQDTERRGRESYTLVSKLSLGVFEPAAAAAAARSSKAKEEAKAIVVELSSSSRQTKHTVATRQAQDIRQAQHKQKHGRGSSASLFPSWRSHAEHVGAGTSSNFKHIHTHVYNKRAHGHKKGGANEQAAYFTHTHKHKHAHIYK